MAEWVTKISDTPAQSVLTQSEMEQNALNVMAILCKDYYWSLTAVAGALGNMQVESHINPGACEWYRGVPSSSSLYYGGGLGLIQITDYRPYIKEHVHPILWCADYANENWWDGKFQCQMLTMATNSIWTACGEGVGALWGWMESPTYPSIPFNDYIGYTGTPDEAAEYWYYCMESHMTEQYELEARKSNALYWYDFLLDKDPDIPTPSPTPPVYSSKKGMPVWMMCRRPHL